MKKNNSKINTLIKRKSLIKLLRKNDIGRISPEAINKIESLIKDFIMSLSSALKEKITTKGKKTLEKEDIEEISQNKNLEYNWEI